MTTPTSITLLAPAKINLSLRVTSLRADGMHELDAPTVPLSLADTVTVTLRGDGRCKNSWHLDDEADETELGLRAARLLKASSGVSHGVSIHITKRIPVGSGLGGGSSDAAAVLVACNRLWDLRRPLARLAELGKKLGADVPFFVHCRQARMRGIGDRLESLPKPQRGWCVLLTPDFRCQTNKVFTEHDHADLTKGFKLDRIIGYAQRNNDLVPAALRLQPSLSTCLHGLYKTAGEAYMSGSGSTCFARLPDRNSANTVANKLASFPGQVTVARIMQGRVRTMGSGQAVRQRILAPSCVGSNPTSPAFITARP